MDRDTELESEAELLKKTGYQNYEKAKDTLKLTVENFKDDLNLLKIHGSTESLKKIFRELIDGLDSRKHSDHEIEDDWKYVSNRQHLRPGGTYMVTVDGREDIWVMTVMNVNARDYKPILEEMHKVVVNSITNAGKTDDHTKQQP